MFFINSGKKILRGVGYVLSALMLVLCVGLIVISLVFGSDGAVRLFGYNIYIAQTDEFDDVALGSAVVVRDIRAYDLNEGNLVVFNMVDGSVMGYVQNVSLVDGVYQLTAFDSKGTYDFTENELVGKAEYASLFWGNLIKFIKTPWGVAVMALLPCVALILFDIARAAAAKLPPPEVEPQLKVDDRPSHVPGISVKEDGKAQYNRSANQNPNTDATGVLFSYAGKQTAKKPDIIPLTDRKPAEAASAKTPARTGGTPASVAARRYLDSAVAPAEKSGDTAELPELPKKSRNDAFFAQSSVPQIGRQKPSSHSVAELEDALASIGGRSEKQPATKRSSEILAQKGTSELFLDDQPDDRGRYDVDDILAGLGKKK